jgi:murein DD-endopeptidase MepM/ murein hydrolase activator NlpD
LLFLLTLGARADELPSGVPPAAPSAAIPPLRFVSLPPSLRQGDPLLLEIEGPEALADLHLELRAATGGLLSRAKLVKLPASGSVQVWLALGGLDWEAAVGPATLRLRAALNGAPVSIEAPLTVLARVFPTEDVKLDAANTSLRTEPDPRKTAEAVTIQTVYARLDPAEFWATGPFLLPVGEAPRSAGFGDRRRYLYAKGGTDSIWHTGIDFAVPVGTPVLAPAAGRIVFSDTRIVTGYTVLIEHLPGLYSVLMHLSKGVAPVGSLVKAGDIVALSGMTGLATGPHLHWEMRSGEIPVDPDYFLGPWAAAAIPSLGIPR